MMETAHEVFETTLQVLSGILGLLVWKASILQRLLDPEDFMRRDVPFRLPRPARDRPTLQL
jgi:hypothetical protein